MRIVHIGLFAAPLAAIAIGVWAEFAELTAPVLFVVALPAMIVSTLCAAFALRQWPALLVLPLGGVIVGVVTFGLSEGTHVSLALARGSDLDFGDYQSRAAIASLLLGVHLAAGAMVGAGVGAGLALLYAANAVIVRRAALSSSTVTPSPSPRRRGEDAVQ